MEPVYQPSEGTLNCALRLEQIVRVKKSKTNCVIKEHSSKQGVSGQSPVLKMKIETCFKNRWKRTKCELCISTRIRIQ